MKKKIAIFVGIMMLASSFSVFASDVDLSGKSVEELIVLRDAVDDAIFAAGGKTVVEGGEYLVGRDIAAGTYILSVYSTDPEFDYASMNYTIWRDDTSSAKWTIAYNEYVDLYNSTPEGEPKPSEPDYSPYSTALNKYVRSDETGERIVLENGQILSLDPYSDALMTLEKAAGGLFMDEEAPMIFEG